MDEDFISRMNLPDALKNMTKEQLYDLATKIRHYLIRTVADNGGHLAANLVVELTIALHSTVTALATALSGM